MGGPPQQQVEDSFMAKGKGKSFPPKMSPPVDDPFSTKGKGMSKQAEDAPRRERAMPAKLGNEDGVKARGRKSSDKARRNFELNGTYSAKHLRILANRAERAPAPAESPSATKKKGQKR